MVTGTVAPSLAGGLYSKKVEGADAGAQIFFLVGKGVGRDGSSKLAGRDQRRLSKSSTGRLSRCAAVEMEVLRVARIIS